MASLMALVQARVQQAVAACAEAQAWNLADCSGIEVMRPRRDGLGDFSTNAAMVLAAHLRRQDLRLSPRQIAEALLAVWPRDDLLADCTVAGPGFINMTVAPDWYRHQCAAFISHPDHVGCPDLGRGQSWQVEFVSANPTGPLHFGGARNAVLGDSLARVLEAANFRVQREFYVNDAGTQFTLFVESLWTAYLQHHGQAAEFPAEGYAGAYIHSYADILVQRIGAELVQMPRAQALTALHPHARDIVLADVRQEIALIDIEFDRWFREQTLHDDGQVQAAIDRLTELGATYTRDGALWFAASRYADMDQDVVLVRSSGEPTYFAADIAYHRDKLENRGFAQVIDVWSVDHQGHVPRMQAMLRALDLDPARLEIVLYDLVKLVRDGREIAMSKRAGSFLTLREVVAEVGPDAVRFMLLTRAPESLLEFDLDRVIAQNQDNPVYFVQYSHARLCSIQARGCQAGIDMPREADAIAALMQQLQHERELALMKALLDLDEQIEMAIKRLSPHNLTYYAVRIASCINIFYRDCRVLDDSNLPLTRARLLLCEAARLVLARVLFLIGVQAPRTM